MESPARAVHARQAAVSLFPKRGGTRALSLASAGKKRKRNSQKDTGMRKAGLGATLLLVTVLLGLGAAAGKGGKTKPASSDAQALFAAVQADDAGAIERELERSDINSRGPGGQTPLMHAVLSGKVNAVKALLKLGADTSIGEKDGYTPMHGAGFQGRAEIARILVHDGKLNPSDRHEDGHTPFERACWGTEKRHADTAAVLLELGVGEDEVRKCRTSNPATAKVIEAWRKKNSKEL